MTCTQYDRKWIPTHYPSRSHSILWILLLKQIAQNKTQYLYDGLMSTSWKLMSYDIMVLANNRYYLLGTYSCQALSKDTYIYLSNYNMHRYRYLKTLGAGSLQFIRLLLFTFQPHAPLCRYPHFSFNQIQIISMKLNSHAFRSSNRVFQGSRASLLPLSHWKYDKEAH